jgi:hypothetical protein
LRHLILTAAAIAGLSSAAQAQSSPSFPRELDRDIVRSLPSPGEVEVMTDVAGRAAEAILDVPLGGVVRAIDPRSRVGRDDTLADMSGDPYVRERVRDSVDGLAVGMGDMISRVAVVAPELRRALASIEHSLGRAMDGSRDRDYDRRYRDEDRRYDDYDRD